MNVLLDAAGSKAQLNALLGSGNWKHDVMTTPGLTHFHYPGEKICQLGNLPASVVILVRLT